MTMTAALSIPYTKRFQSHLDILEATLDRFLTSQTPQSLWSAMRHGVLNGGKRIRPVLMLETAAACGGPVQAILPAACALELIHCYSLIHDDLPCMDDDILRRGQPTVHVAYGQAIAVLAGDGLLAKAFGVIADETPSFISGKVVLDVISKLSAASGLQGLVSGQAADILATNTQADETTLYQIHAGKTAALFEFAAWAGARLAGVEPEVCRAFAQFGQSFGLAFQLVDDLLDETDQLGKTAGKDQAQGKMTFPAVFGKSKSQDILDETIKALNQQLAAFPATMQTDGLTYLIQFLWERAV